MQKLPTSHLGDLELPTGLSNDERLLLQALVARRGSYVSDVELRHTVYGLFDDPLTPEHLSKTVASLRKKLQATATALEILELDELPSGLCYMIR